MLIKKIILKKPQQIYKKKKYLYLILFIWLKIIKKNYLLVKYNNIKKLLYFTLHILLLKIKKKFIFFFSHLPINFKNNITSLISYVIKITLLKSNIHINITNIYGSTLIACSSGIINLKGSKKTKKFAYNRITKFTKFKIKKLKNKIFAIHFIGTKHVKNKIFKSYKKYLYITNIKHFNLIAHNGCRLKK